MEFRILGRLEVRDRGGVIEIRQPQQRATLGVLALNANRPLTKDQLAEALWGADRPTSASGMLRTLIWRLRRILGEDSGLRTHSTGYILYTEPGDLDTQVFLRLSGEGHAAVAEGDLNAASDVLERALELWSDPPFCDLPCTPDVNAELAQLLDQRRFTQKRLVDVRLAVGRHHEVIGLLRAMTESNPLDEYVWAQLIRALYRSGQQSSALQAYARIRAILATECGVEPGPQLQRLQRQILISDPELGYELPRPSIAGALPARPMARVRGGDRHYMPPFQLPPDLVDFTGRGGQTEDLLRALRIGPRNTAPPVIVVSGEPGSGKTALALHAAHRVRDRFPDGQLYVQLAGSSGRPRRPHDVLGELLRSLGVPSTAVPRTTDERAALYRTVLADRRVLVLADDAAGPGQLRALLPGAVGCAIIVTGRTRVVTANAAHRLDLGPFSAAEALGLLGRIAGAPRVAAEPQAAKRLVRACGLLPLAVRIAGIRLAIRPSWPVAALAEILSDDRRRLAELVVGDLSVDAALGFSYRALDQRARRAFRLLGLPVQNEVTEGMVAALLDEPDVSEVVNDLVDRCLLDPVGVDHYRMPELLKAYAAELLSAEPRGELDAAAERVRVLIGDGRETSVKRR